MKLSSSQPFQLQRSFKNFVSYQNSWGNGTHGSSLQGIHLYSLPGIHLCRLRKMTGHGATAKSVRVVIWLLVSTSHAQQHSSTWSVLDCLRCPVVNNCVQHATLMCTRLRQEKGRVLMLISKLKNYKGLGTTEKEKKQRRHRWDDNTVP